MKIFLIILAVIITYLIGQIFYYRYLAPFTNHVNKSYLWHSGRMKAMFNFKKQVNYIYWLKDLALRQTHPKDKNHLLLVCTDIASGLRMSSKNEEYERADKIFWEIMDIYEHETGS